MFGRGLVGYLPVNIVQAIVGFGSVVIFTRVLSPADYGAYALAFSVTSLVHLICLTWVEAALARFLAVETSESGRADLFATVYRTFAVMMLLAPILAGVIFAAAPVAANLKTAVAIGILTIVARSLLKLAQERRRADGDVRGFAIFDVVQTGGGFLAGVLLALLGWGAAAPLAGAGAASALCLLWAFPGELRTARQGRFDLDRFKTYFAYGVPVSLSLMMSLALSTTDRFVIAAHLNEAAVGAYQAGYTLSNRSLDVLFLWFGMAGQPACIAALERGGREALMRTAADQAALLVAIALPASVGLMLVSKPLVHLMVGPALAETAAGVTPWIAVGALLSGLTTQYFNSAFTLARRTRRLFAAIAIPAAANLVLVLILVPKFGLNGALWATVLSYALGLIASNVLARGSPIALPIPWKTLLQSGAAVLAMAAVVRLAPETGGVFELLLKSLLGAFVYAALALAMNIADARARVRTGLILAVARLRQRGALAGGAS